jgi:hypothetical protein
VRAQHVTRGTEVAVVGVVDNNYAEITLWQQQQDGRVVVS